MISILIRKIVYYEQYIEINIHSVKPFKFQNLTSSPYYILQRQCIKVFAKKSERFSILLMINNENLLGIKSPIQKCFHHQLLFCVQFYV